MYFFKQMHAYMFKQAKKCLFLNINLHFNLI